MNVRKADAAFRRFVFVFVAVAVCASGVLLVLFDRYKTALAGWVMADRSVRLQLVFVVFALLLVVPLVAMAAYLSVIGGRAVRSGEYEALTRGRVLQGLSVFLCGAAVVIGLLLWRLSSMFAARLG